MSGDNSFIFRTVGWPFSEQGPFCWWAFQRQSSRHSDEVKLYKKVLVSKRAQRVSCVIVPENDTKTIKIVTTCSCLHHFDGTAGQSKGHRPNRTCASPTKRSKKSKTSRVARSSPASVSSATLVSHEGSVAGRGQGRLDVLGKSVHFGEDKVDIVVQRRNAGSDRILQWSGCGRGDLARICRLVSLPRP